MNSYNESLEFRKIPSLLFFYEINSNGTIIRNIKSKRRVKCRIEYINDIPYWTYEVYIKGQTIKGYIDRTVAECWIGSFSSAIQHIDGNTLNNDYRNLRYTARILHPVRIIGNGESLDFNSFNEAAIYLSNKYGKNTKTIYDKLSMRRHHIYDYDIQYLAPIEVL